MTKWRTFLTSSLGFICEGFDEEQRILWEQLESFVLGHLSTVTPWEPQQGAFGAAAIIYPVCSQGFKEAVFAAAV